MLEPLFTVLILVPLVFLFIVEMIGIARKKKGDTITEHWEWFDRYLEKTAPWARWIFRVFTAGLLTWTILHFLVGTP